MNTSVPLPSKPALQPGRPSCLLALVLAVAAIFLKPEAVQAQRLLGTDVSAYQPSVNWTTVKNAGVTFAWAKATENTGWTSSYFASQEAGAKSVGILIGAYHFARPSSNPNLTGANSADSEAAHFWSVAGAYIKPGGSYLVPMLDWEDTSATVAKGFTSSANMSAWVIQWCNTVSNYARAAGVPGLRPVIYTGAWYSKPSSTYPGLTTAVTSYPSWISYYPASDGNGGYGTPYPLKDPFPSSTYCYPWSVANIWQYGDTNWSGGDSDVFAGTLSSFSQMFVIGGTNFPSFTTSPTNLTVAAGASATFAAKVSGQAPLTFQWLFNGTVIPGATSSNYTLPSAQLANAGAYALRVANSYGSASSAPVFLSVVAPLTNAPGSILAPSGLVDWWPADGNLNDIYGGKNATAYNSFTYATGKQGLAFHFDGSSSYLTTGAPSLPVPWTACFWVYRQNAPGTGAALTGDGSYELKLEQYNGTRQVGFTAFGVADNKFSYTVPQSSWTHLAFVASGTQMQLYANGALVGTIATNIPCPRAYIGAGYVSSGSYLVDFMLGSLDEVQFFNRALASTEIRQLYTAGSAGLVRAPQFSGTGLLTGSQFQLKVIGMTGKTFSIYRSPDFVSWTRIATGVANPAGSVFYTDATATAPCNFYRLTQP